MRNLKRALSLALASIMVLGMMVVGAGAVSVSDFTDGEKIVNKDAVTVLTTLNVINGKDDNSYDPEGTVTRAEMAKMICVILNGGKDPSLGDATTNTFTDTVGHWASAYIEYCTKLGIVSGRGNGTFDPNGNVTGSEAAKMLLAAAGYQATIEGFVGANWEIGTNVRANQVGLYDGLDIVPSAALNRDNAAQMVYNTLDIKVVTYKYTLTTTDGSTISSVPELQYKNATGVFDITVLEDKFGAVKVEGVVIANEFANMEASKKYNADKAPATLNIGASLDDGKTEILVTNFDDSQTDYANGKHTFTVSTGEEVLGKTVYMYVKPSTTSLKSTVIGAVIISDDNTIVTDASNDTAKEVADDNNLDIIPNETRYVYNYADMSTSAPAKDGYAGVQKTLIDTDGDGDVNYVLYKEMRLGKVTQHTDVKDGRIVVAIDGVTKGNYVNDDKADIVGFDNVAKDDYVLTAYIGGRLYVEKPETVTGTIEAYKQTNIKNAAGTVTGYRNTGFTIDGETYTVSRVDTFTGTELNAAVTEVDKSVLSSEATFYLDQNGYLIAYGEVNESAYKYAYVWGAEAGTKISTDRVKVTTEDGTTKTYYLSSSSDIDVVEDTDSNVAQTSNDRAQIRESDMSGNVFSYSITSGGDIKLYLAKKGTYTHGNPDFTKGLTAIKFNGKASEVSLLHPAELKSTDVNLNNTYYSNNATTFFYVTHKDNDPTKEIDKVSVYNGRNAAPTVDGTQGTAMLALNSKGDVASAVFSNVKVTESADDHMFVYNANYVWDEYGYVDAFMNGSTEATKDMKAAYVDEIKGEIVHNPTVTDGIYIYSLNSDGYYELTKPTTSKQSYYFTGVVARVNKGSNTFVITDDGTISGKFSHEFRLDAKSIVVDYDSSHTSPVAVAGGSVTVGDQLQIIVNNADDSVVLMAGIMDRVETGNGGTGPSGDWTLPTNAEYVTVLDQSGDVGEINNVFRANKNVIIDGSWTMAAETLNIPSNKTLYVNGNLDATSGVISNRGNLVVNGTLTTDNSGTALGGTVLAKNWVVKDGISTAGIITVEDTVTITTTKTLTVPAKSELYAGDVTVAAGVGNSANLIVGGHVDVAGDVKVAGTVTVTSSKTLKVGGALEVSTLTLGAVGDKDKAGTVTAGSIKAASIDVKIGSALTVDATIETTTGGIKVEDATLNADTVKLPSGQKLEIKGEPKVDVPTVSGEVDVSGVTGGNVNVATDKDSAVVVKTEIKKDITYSGEVTFETGASIAKDVTVTLNSTVNGIDELARSAAGAKVVFGAKAIVRDSTTTYFKDNKGTTPNTRDLGGNTFVSDGTDFIVQKGSPIYVTGENVTAVKDSARIYA